MDIVEDNIIEEDNVIENKEENINNEIIDLSNDSVIDESIADIKGNIIIGDTVDYAELVEKKYKENNSVRLNILKYIIILLMISIEIILFIRKKKIKSNVENI